MGLSGASKVIGLASGRKDDSQSWTGSQGYPGGAPESPALQSTKYRTIVADPPWDYDGMRTGLTFGIGDTDKEPYDQPLDRHIPYPTLTLDEIKALPVEAWADDIAHLYLWTTNRYVRHVWDVAEEWGFVGKTLLVWCKAPFGFKVGGTWPSTSEFCLFATRGRLAKTPRAKSQWFQLPRQIAPPVGAGESRQTSHSAKPEAFLDMVEQVSTGPYLEMFSRRARLGWDTWGNESLHGGEAA